jgi:hypothetical protein
LRERLQALGYSVAERADEADILLEYQFDADPKDGQEPLGCHLLAWDARRHCLLAVSLFFKPSGPEDREGDTLWFDREEQGIVASFTDNPSGSVEVSGQPNFPLAAVRSLGPPDRPGVRIELTESISELPGLLMIVTESAGCDVVRPPAVAKAVLGAVYQRWVIGRYEPAGGDAYAHSLQFDVFGADDDKDPVRHVLYSRKFQASDPARSAYGGASGFGKGQIYKEIEDQRCPDEIARALQRAVETAR